MKKSRQGERAAVQVSIRATQGLLDRADALVQRADEWPESGGTVSTRASVLRIALLVGLRSLENRKPAAPAEPAAVRWVTVSEAEAKAQVATGVWQPPVWQAPAPPQVETEAPPQVETEAPPSAAGAKKLEYLRGTDWAKALPLAEYGLRLEQLRLWELECLYNALGNAPALAVLLGDAARTRGLLVERG